MTQFLTPGPLVTNKEADTKRGYVIWLETQEDPQLFVISKAMSPLGYELFWVTTFQGIGFFIAKMTVLLLSYIEPKGGGWGGGSAAKSTGYSPRGPDSISNFLELQFQETPHPLMDFMGTRNVHVAHTYMQAKHH